MFTFGKFFVVLLLLNSLIHEISFGQEKNARGIGEADPGSVIDSTIQAQIESLYGIGYVTTAFSVDSLLNKQMGYEYGDEVYDRYRTLSHCVLFGASYPPNDSVDGAPSVFGIFREGSIVWHSDTLIHGELDHIFGIDDINHDGKIDIITEWRLESGGIVNALWIFDYDGSQGRLVIQLDSTGQSSLLGESNGFFLIDVPYDSAREIRAYWDQDENVAGAWPRLAIATLPYVTFSWNGSAYGIWNSTRQVASWDPLDASRLRIVVNANVEKLGNQSYLYRYKLWNDGASAQTLKGFVLQHVDSVAYNHVPEYWDTCAFIRPWGGQGWLLKEFGVHHSIVQGAFSDSLEFVSELPSIVAFTAHGENTPQYGADSVPTLADDWRNLFENGFHGVTIGPRMSYNAMNANWFLDTLQSYCRISDSLHWITDRSHYLSYSKHLEFAKTYLGNKDMVAARSEMEKMLGEVLSDTASLTSEGYALLRYNLEFIIGKLPKAR